MINNQYQIVFTITAKEDLKKISYYISNILKNKTASKNLRDKIYDQAYQVGYFPYAHAIYESKNINYQYRSFRVKNYRIFYVIHEKQKKVLIIRIMYKRRNFNEFLSLLTV